MVDDAPRERLTFWWEATAAAWALARALREGPSLAGQRAVELGCGPGLVGTAAALAGAHVTFTDGEPEALRLAAARAARAGVPAGRTATLVLDWERPAACGPFDLVLGAEIAYDYWVHGDLVRLIDALLAPDGTAWLADRRRLAIDRFLGRLRDAGFALEATAVDVDEPGFPAQRVHLFRITRA